MPLNTFLEGEGLLLQLLTEADCREAYTSWFNDPQVCRYNSHHLFPLRPEALLTYVKQTQASTTDLVLAIVQKFNQRHIGNVSLQQIDLVNRHAEFSILIGEKDCWGKGYSKEAGRLLLDHAFLSLNLHRVHCGTTQDNLPMQALANFLGMMEEGRRREVLFKHNRYLDVIEYGLLKPEYLARFHTPSSAQSDRAKITQNLL